MKKLYLTALTVILTSSWTGTVEADSEVSNEATLDYQQQVAELKQLEEKELKKLDDDYKKLEKEIGMLKAKSVRRYWRTERDIEKDLVREKFKLQIQTLNIKHLDEYKALEDSRNEELKNLDNRIKKERKKIFGEPANVSRLELMKEDINRKYDQQIAELLAKHNLAHALKAYEQKKSEDQLSENDNDTNTSIKN